MARHDQEVPDLDGEESFKVEDRRHWTHGEGDAPDDRSGAPPRTPTVVDEYRLRAEAAERKLLEYIEAFKERQREQDALRERLAREVERRAEARFAELVGELVQTADDLELALAHAQGQALAERWVRGVTIARDRFLSGLERQGIKRIDPVGQPFDPQEAEALRVDPVDSAEDNNRVTQTLQPGFRLGERVIRPARVAVGRYAPAD